MSIRITTQHSIAVLLYAAGSLAAHAENAEGGLPTAAGLYMGARRSDIVWGRSLISPNAIKGTMGESFASKVYTTRVLKDGNWKTLTPRSGPQGLDHLYIQTNREGWPADLLVGESKYNTSRLGKTLSGIQMGDGWTSPKLARLGVLYHNASSANIWQFGAPPLKTAQEINVFLPTGKSVSFWKPVNDSEWIFSGKQEELSAAQRMAGSYGKYLCAAGTNRITYKKRIYHIIPDGNNIKVDICDAAKVPDSGNIKALSLMGSFRIKDAFSDKNRLPAENRREIAKILQRKLGLSDSEALRFADDIRNSTSARSMTRPFSYAKSIAKTSAIAGAIGAGLDLGIQALTSDDIDVSQAGVSAGILAVSAGSGSAAQIFPRKLGMSVKSLSGSLGGSSTAIKLLGGGAALATSLALVDIKHLAEGNLTTQQFAQSLSLALSGPAASGLLFTMVAAYGTASTGTAISTLSGIAAYNATMASLGGGSLATGGMGILGGGAVMGGVAIAVTGAVYIGFRIYDKKQEEYRMEGNIEWMDNNADILKAWRNHLPVIINPDESCSLQVTD